MHTTRLQSGSVQVSGDEVAKLSLCGEIFRMLNY